jgi:hypothetical protein
MFAAAGAAERRAGLDPATGAHGASQVSSAGSTPAHQGVEPRRDAEPRLELPAPPALGRSTASR